MKRRSLTLVPLAIALLTPAVCAAQAPATPEAALLDAEDQRFKAQIDHDAAALDATIAAGANFAHSSGYRQSKDAFIGAIGSGKMAYTAIVPHDRVALVVGDIGIVRGTVSITLADKVTINSYLAAYTRQGGHWRLLDWQTGSGPKDPSTYGQ